MDWGETGWNLIEMWNFGGGVSADNPLVGLGTRSIDELAQIADDATTADSISAGEQEPGRFRAG